MTDRFLAFDAETGGLEPSEHDLLTIFFAILDENLDVCAELDLTLKPDKKHQPYRVTAEALGVNKIDLVKHHQNAIPMSQGRAELIKFLQNYKPRDAKLVPVGHNLSLDVGMVKTHLLEPSQWSGFVDHRQIDTCVIANFMMRKGQLKIPNASLETLVSYFNVPKLPPHVAKNDVIMTVGVLRSLWKL